MVSHWLEKRKPIYNAEKDFIFYVEAIIAGESKLLR